MLKYSYAYNYTTIFVSIIFSCLSSASIHAFFIAISAVKKINNISTNFAVAFVFVAQQFFNGNA